MHSNYFSRACNVFTDCVSLSESYKDGNLVLSKSDDITMHGVISCFHKLFTIGKLAATEFLFLK